ncbi:NADPH-ferrihemoprotein reductase [Coprinopsis cinerea okayama7|uniref:NADPH-ferrihemoprotein reductase n=1 Tax=Coprinopsis cinerea (strain Okayama-7 / 130 / ATCC MYA-4618 / FGSC 9003) TaxID=240176 RepID=D6RQ83_COPC7|nr:NADPH-ferrihemoprotein reductase [Coprinopsis cinerea okayama7\|eukprot:XP_002910383.1 NADPH-ferrihemoprotein reductase [Coprinopsis cinerea okayama7\
MNNEEFDGVEEIPRELLILYATETGNSQDCADYIARQCRRIAFRCRVVSMDKYSLPDLISEPLVIFVVSTTGSGVEPRAMTALWNMLLRSELPDDLFEGLPFTVFGLGDTGYEKFCWAAKKLSRRMKTLGATEICERGEGDEQDPLGIDGALFPWVEKLLGTLLQLAPLPSPIELSDTSELPPPRVALESAQDVTSTDPVREDTRYNDAVVKTNTRITAEDWYQDVRHIEFEFEDDIRYNPGDVAVIHPVASQSDVAAFLEVMNWTECADEPLTVVHKMADQSLPDFLPQRVTLRTLFTRYLDFNAVPRRSFFQYIRNFTTDDLEREKLDEFLTGPEGAEELYEYCQKKHPHQMHVCVAIVKYRTKLKIPRRGVCSTYLASLQPGDKLRIGILKGLIKLPPNYQTPVICVGPGTANTLYFGCRSEDKDQHYGEEWRRLSESQELVYRTAFSRDGPEGVKRTYVQDRILEDAERIWRLVGEEGAWVYISGSSNKMPIAVKDAIAQAVQNDN